MSIELKIEAIREAGRTADAKRIGDAFRQVYELLTAYGQDFGAGGLLRALQGIEVQIKAARAPYAAESALVRAEAVLQKQLEEL